MSDSRRAQRPNEKSSATAGGSERSKLTEFFHKSKVRIGTASGWLGEFNFPKHDDGFFVADLALIYRPSILFIN